MMGVLTLPTLEDLDVPDATFERPDLTTFARLDELGLEVVGQRLEPDRAVLSCRVVDPDGWCRRCGCEGVARDTVAMDGFTGFKTATTEELPDAVPVMDPFHVVRLAGQALDECRRRIQQASCGHRGRKGDPLYSARHTLHTRADLLTDKQQQRLETLFVSDAHVQVQATWGIYRRMITAYREPDRVRGRDIIAKLITSVSHGVPQALSEIITLGRTLTKRATCWPTSTVPAPATARPKRSVSVVPAGLGLAGQDGPGRVRSVRDSRSN